MKIIKRLSASFFVLMLNAILSTSCRTSNNTAAGSSPTRTTRPPGKLLLTAESTSHGDALVLPKESVCYDILHVRIDNTQSLPNWLTFRDFIRQAENNCIGVKGIKAIYTAVQNRLISHGFITTRVLIPEQNLLKGTLTLRILPGRVSDVIIQDQSGLPVHRWNNVPQGAGDLLDLRGLEQGLENLQRIPGSQASIRLVPGKIPAIAA
jgi:hemolysin activation/secretion protein